MKCKDDSECAFGQNNEKIKQCDMGVYWGRHESCFTQTHQNGIVERGCTVDSRENSWNWCSKADNCVECSEDGCNSANVRYHSCGQCSGDKGSDCATLPDSNAIIKKCDSVQHYPYAKRGCYTIKEGEFFAFFLFHIEDNSDFSIKWNNYIYYVSLSNVLVFLRVLYNS